MSTRYRITTPEPAYTGEVGNCAFAKGVYEGPVEPGPLGYFRSQGYGVEDLDAEPTEPEQADEVAPLPAKSASKPDWVAAAVARGINEVDAEKATKEQLIELLNTPNDPPAPEENENP